MEETQTPEHFREQEALTQAEAAGLVERKGLQIIEGAATAAQAS